MSTHSNIGILSSYGSVDMVYCHWDGYLSNNGKLLLQNYDTEEKVLSLLVQGDISSLNKTVQSCEFYHRDGGDVLTPARHYESVEQACGEMEEYMYLFDVANNKWLYSSGRGKIRDLTLDLCVD